ncbi:hypothetical protein [Helicobacter cinaedi]|nr:hypothetical protein [Helicobacter cinaedi]
MSIFCFAWYGVWGFEALCGRVVAGICSVLLDLVFMCLSLGAFDWLCA